MALQDGELHPRFDNVDEAKILHDMFVVMVHQMPDRVATISHGKRFYADWEGHELRFRIRDGVVEAFCFSCQESRK